MYVNAAAFLLRALANGYICGEFGFYEWPDDAERSTFEVSVLTETWDGNADSLITLARSLGLTVTRDGTECLQSLDTARTSFLRRLPMHPDCWGVFRAACTVEEA